MADLSDVEVALETLVTAAVYPAGVPAGSAPPSPTAGAPVRVRRGWPDATKLDADLAAGIVNVSIYSMPGHSRPVPRYTDEWRLVASGVPTITATVTGNQVTFSGSGGPGQLAGVQLAGVAYAVQAPSDAADVATALAAIVPGATADGDVLTLTAAPDYARTGAGVTEAMEVRRQVQGFRIGLWCPTPATRDTVASVVDAALASFDQEFVTLPDGSGGLVRYQGTLSDDVPSKANLWRRDLQYSVEYPTLLTRTTPPILFPTTTVQLSVS